MLWFWYKYYSLLKIHFNEENSQIQKYLIKLGVGNMDKIDICYFILVHIYGDVSVKSIPKLLMNNTTR